jgi:ribosomal protein S18 acetylase RimI-like enzyme
MNNPKDGGDYHFFAAVDAEGKLRSGSVIDIGPMRFGPLADTTIGFLENIEVLEVYRRKGIGSALLMAALDCAWKCGAQNVRWTVEYSNVAGIGLYRTLGLAFIPEEDPSVSEPERCYTIVAMNPRAMKDGYAR